ncbi:MAG: AraC family ligand binding domain-containing protein, partial [Bacteroidota bacterium]
MDVIKQYTDIHPEDHLQSYAIKRMEDLYAKFGGQADAPHRHDYYTILCAEEAFGKHLLDFKEYTLGARQIYFVSPGQVHQLVEKAAPKGFVLTFSQAFLVQNGIEACFIEDLHLFQDAGESPPLEPTEEEWEELKSILNQIEAFSKGDEKFKDQGVGALLKLFLIRCNNSCTLPIEDNTQVTQASVSLLRQFKSLVETHYKNWHKV